MEEYRFCLDFYGTWYKFVRILGFIWNMFVFLFVVLALSGCQENVGIEKVNKNFN